MVCEPILMVCSVTEDSSLEVAGSHLSGALASGALDSLSGACATTREDAANKQKNPARPNKKLFFIGCSHLRSVMARRPPTRRDCTLRRTRSQRKGLHRGPTHNRRLSRSTKAARHSTKERWQSPVIA